jgi:hypothetical protein
MDQPQDGIFPDACFTIRNGGFTGICRRRQALAIFLFHLPKRRSLVLRHITAIALDMLVGHGVATGIQRACRPAFS